MELSGLEAFIATSYTGSYYLSGAPIHPFGRPLATILPLKGEPVMVLSIIEQEHVEEQSWVRDLQYYWDYNPKPEFENPRPPLESLLILMKEVLQDRELAESRVGFEDATLPVSHYERLHAAFPAVTLLGASAMLDRARQVLSAEELHLLCAADSIADIGQQELINGLGRGNSAREIVTAVRTAMEEVVLARHPDYPFAFRIATGLESPLKGGGHSEWITWNAESRAKPGQVVTTGVDVLFWGYQGNVERTVVIGPPNARVRSDFEIMVEANEAAIAAVKPGTKLADVDRITKEIFERHGYGTRSGSGLGRGITSYEGNARELSMDVRLYSDVILAPGMAFSLEPDLKTKDGTYRHCNTLIVTAEGCEVDSKLPRGLIWV
jgi:Xaa-Pro aminopeptidase